MGDPADDPAAGSGERSDCGTFRFGDSRIRVFSSLAEIDPTFFWRFAHRAIPRDLDAEIVEISRSENACLLSFRGGLMEETTTALRMFSCLTRFLLSLEHANTPLLAFCHAAAVCRDGRSVLMPGRSGIGKSTLAAFLVGHGFTYLGDDVVAIGEQDGALFPLPTCLSVKTGSWQALEHLYPVLPQLPALSRYGRTMRYVEPAGNYRTMAFGASPSALLFPVYAFGEATRLNPLAPLEKMIRVVGAHATLVAPATEEKLAKWLRFVEQTPAYELTYSELPSALEAIEDLLASQP